MFDSMNTSYINISDAFQPLNTPNELQAEIYQDLPLLHSPTALGSVVLTAILMLYGVYSNRSLVDSHGNRIPNGPWGLPIFG